MNSKEILEPTSKTPPGGAQYLVEPSLVDMESLDSCPGGEKWCSIMADFW